MRKWKCPKCIKRKNIYTFENEKRTECEKVKIVYKESGYNILVISDYPRRLSENLSNPIIQRVVKYFDKNFLEDICEIKEVNIMNLISCYDVSSEVEESNLENILEEMKKADIIIYAWGENKNINEIRYNEKIRELLINARNVQINSDSRKVFFKVGNLTKNGYPKHVLSWSYDDIISNYYI